MGGLECGKLTSIIGLKLCQYGRIRMWEVDEYYRIKGGLQLGDYIMGYIQGLYDCVRGVYHIWYLD